MKNVLLKINNFIEKAEKNPILPYAIIVSVIFFFFRSSIVLGFTGTSADIIINIPKKMATSLLAIRKP